MLYVYKIMMGIFHFRSSYNWSGCDFNTVGCYRVNGVPFFHICIFRTSPAFISYISHIQYIKGPSTTRRYAIFFLKRLVYNVEKDNPYIPSTFHM